MNQKTKYLTLAKLTLLLHVSIMAWLYVGTYISFKNHAFIPFHIAGVALIIVLRQMMGGSCVLTVIEKKYLVKAGKEDYGNSCYSHHFFQGIIGLTLTDKQILYLLITFKIVPSLTPLLIYVF